MKNNVLIFGLLILLGCASGKSGEDKSDHSTVRWDFDTLDGWIHMSQDENPDSQCQVSDGILKIYTRANSWDRKKMYTEAKTYSTGRYTWKTYIPQMGEGDQASVGSWIYCDDHHEIDFEVGYGTEFIRNSLSASPEEMIAYMTTQDHPFQSIPVKIPTGWHIFEIDLTERENKYYVTWIIDGREVASVWQNYGPEFKFHIYCSVENLKFLGDHIPQQENYGLFDYVTYEYHE